MVKLIITMSTIINETALMGLGRLPLTITVKPPLPNKNF